MSQAKPRRSCKQEQKALHTSFLLSHHVPFPLSRKGPSSQTDGPMRWYKIRASILFWQFCFWKKYSRPKWCVNFPSFQGKMANYWKPCWEWGWGEGVDRKFWNWIRIHSSLPFSHLLSPSPLFLLWKFHKSLNAIAGWQWVATWVLLRPPPSLPFSIPIFMVIALQGLSFYGCARRWNILKMSYVKYTFLLPHIEEGLK